MDAKEAPAVGIDLGTTYSCVGVWKNRKVEIIANEQGNRTTPSCVAFTDIERLIGEGALNQAHSNPANTIYDVKRLIGRRFSDVSVQSDRKIWPFSVIGGEDDKPAIVVNYMKQEKRFSPQEISSMILFKMKEIASTFLGRPVRKAVVTVPAYFNNSQRQATKDAATIADLEVIQIINEPTAAALAYSHDNKDNCDRYTKTILIFDLGGGTLDVSLIKLDGHGVVEVMATSGDPHLGGQDFDNRMVQYILEFYERKYKHDVSKNRRCVSKLKRACERTKRMLSTQPVAAITIEAFYEGEDFSEVFTRAKFDDLNMDLFQKCMVPVELCLRDANVQKNSVDEVVLVGGSTRIPKVQEMLQKFFQGKELYKSINADEAVAYGASIQAAICTNDKKDPEAPQLALLDVTPLSLGITVNEGVMSIMIPRNSRVPCIFERHYETGYDNQREMRFQILEGERRMSADNNLLGEFLVSGIKPAPAGTIKFKCTFRIDVNGILTVTARNEDDNKNKGMTITRDKFTLSKNEIDRMIREARMYELQDKERNAKLAEEMESAGTSSRCVLQ